MVLALAIGMLLLAAVYMTFNIHLVQTKAGRDSLAEGALARYAISRIADDISTQVAAYDPRMINIAANAASAAASSGASASSSSSSSSSNSSNSSASTTPPTTNGVNTTGVTFNIGVWGNDTSLVLSKYHVQPPTPDVLNGTPTTDASSDLRVVCYWMVSNGDKQALARKEFRQATNLALETIPPTNVSDAAKCIIAEEVSNIKFEYFDGQTWQPSWDGTVVEASGSPPVGPPLAIRITVTLYRNGNDPAGPSFVHVAAIPTANFNNPQQNSP
jgi:hypothetical protein